MYTLGIATSAALPPLSRSRVLTQSVGTMPARAEVLEGAPGPVIGGNWSVYGIERSLSCCSTIVWATRALWWSVSLINYRRWWKLTLRRWTNLLGHDSWLESCIHSAMCDASIGQIPDQDPADCETSWSESILSALPLVNCLRLPLSLLTSIGLQSPTAKVEPNPFSAEILTSLSTSKATPWAKTFMMRWCKGEARRATKIVEEGSNSCLTRSITRNISTRASTSWA